MKKQLGDKKHAYYKEYRYVAGFSKYFRALGKYVEPDGGKKTISWSELSWRAIVPLQEAGYCIKEKDNTQKDDIPATIDLLRKMGVSNTQALHYDKELIKLLDKQYEIRVKEANGVQFSEDEIYERNIINSDSRKKQQRLISELQIFKNILSDYKQDNQYLNNLLEQLKHENDADTSVIEADIKDAIKQITDWRTGALHPKRLPQVIKQADGTFRYDCPRQL